MTDNGLCSLLVKFFLLSVSIILLIAYWMIGGMNCLLISALLFFLFFLLHALKKSPMLFLFLISFYTFMLSYYTYQLFAGENWWYGFSKDTAAAALYCVYLAMVSLMAGSAVGKRIWLKQPDFRQKEIIVESDRNLRLRSAARIVFYITCIPALYVVLSKVSFTMRHSYVEYYLHYEQPAMLIRLAAVNTVSFFMFLATLPDKKAAGPIVVMYLGKAVISLLSGGRTAAVVVCLVVLFYYIYRNSIRRKLANREIWLSKKAVTVILAALPFIIVFLSAWSYVRSSFDYSQMTFADLFFGFFKDSGSSVNVISYAIDYRGALPPTNISYTFGPVINFLRNNMISRVLFGFQQYTDMSTASALYGNNFSYTITYIAAPSVYAMGGGLGSAYIAELFADFGHFGVIIYNIIIGIVLTKIGEARLHRPWVFVLILVVVDSIINMPRYSAMYWVSELLSFTTIATMCGLYLLAFVTSRRERHPKDNGGWIVDKYCTR